MLVYQRVIHCFATKSPFLTGSTFMFSFIFDTAQRTVSNYAYLGVLVGSATEATRTCIMEPPTTYGSIQDVIRFGELMGDLVAISWRFIQDLMVI